MGWGWGTLNPLACYWRQWDINVSFAYFMRQWCRAHSQHEHWMLGGKGIYTSPGQWNFHLQKGLLIFRPTATGLSPPPKPLHHSPVTTTFKNLSYIITEEQTYFCTLNWEQRDNNLHIKTDLRQKRQLALKCRLCANISFHRLHTIVLLMQQKYFLAF